MLIGNQPWIESPFFYEIVKSKGLSKEQEQIAVDYHKNGYVVISGLFQEKLIDDVKNEVEEKGFDFKKKIKRRDERRLQDFWLRSDLVSALAASPAIMEVLTMLYGRKAIPFQTLNFRLGSQQRAHSDTIHFSSLPARFMCGVWVALEDITEQNGPVFYYPGSHKLPEYNFSDILPSVKTPSYEEDYMAYEDFIEHIIQANELTPQHFLAKKGDALIWSSNILHGGAPVKDPDTTRWSQVTHYFFEDCYYYTPMLSNMITGELYIRNNLTNIATGEKIEQRYNGQQLYPVQSAKNLYVLRDKPERSFWDKLTGPRT